MLFIVQLKREGQGGEVRTLITETLADEMYINENEVLDAAAPYSINRLHK